MNDNECPKCTLGKAGECFHCDTQTTPAPHTPTPWSIEMPYGEGGVYIQGSAPARTNPIICSVAQIRDEVPKHLVGDQQSNARLITASVNSYAKHCGPNAIQCAEDDLLGQALEVLRECVNLDDHEDPTTHHYHVRLSDLAERVRGILSRLPQ
jgi:hypothetical protein